MINIKTASAFPFFYGKMISEKEKSLSKYQRQPYLSYLGSV
jgi:hypothetical protein